MVFAQILQLIWVFVFFYAKSRVSHDAAQITSYMSQFEPRHEKTNILYMRKQRRRSASGVTAKLISAFVFATKIV